MKHTINFILAVFCSTLCFTYACNKVVPMDSDNSVVVIGQLETGLSSDGIVSKEITNILFLQEKGQLVSPNSMGMYLFDLDDDSSKKLGRKSIWIIPVNEIGYTFYSDRWHKYNKELTMKVHPVRGREDVYYIKDNELLTSEQIEKKEKLKRFLTSPSGGDTLRLADIDLLRHNYLYMPIWIDQLNNTTSITFEYIIPNDCSPMPSVYYNTVSISEIVRSSLKLLGKNSFGLETPQPGATKEEWCDWYNRLEMPELKVPETEARWVIEMGWGKLDGGNFRQRADNGDIYYIRCDSTFIVHTDDNSLERVPTCTVNYNKIEWRTQSESENIEIRKWIDTQVDISKYSYTSIPEGNIVVAIRKNKIQQQAYLYKTDASGKLVSEGVLLDALVPLQIGPYHEINIQKIFVKDNQYYIILQIKNTSYWFVFDADKIIN